MSATEGSSESTRPQPEQTGGVTSFDDELHDFFENASVGLHWVGADGTILRANRAELELLGYAPEEYVGHHIAQFHTDAKVIEDILQRLASGETLCNYEASLRCKDGSVRHVVINSNVLWRDGQFVHTRCFTRDVTERKLAERQMYTEHAVTRILAEARSLAEAAPRVLEAICETTGWQWAALWTIDPQEHVLRCTEVWHRPDVDVRQFEQFSREAALQRGVGLPGRVWETAQPLWIADVAVNGNFPRRSAAVESGLRTALAFPVLIRGTVAGVMEFFSRQAREPDDALLSMLLTIGAQVGQFVERTRAEQALRESEARNAAVLVAALDCIVSMDHEGKVIEWNPAAERTFGYSRDEALGREMAALIIPPSFRQVHREGLARYLATGHGPVLGRRFEITAVRKEGTEFPVELTIIRLPAGGPPTFTGYIRDITDRKRAEEARRMSEFRWQRLVEQSPLSTQLFAPDGTVRQVNRAWERLWGVTLADLPGYNILKDGQLVERGIMPSIQKAFAGEAATVEPIPYIPDRGDYAGQVRWCGAYIYPVKDDAGRIEEVVLVHEDVTDRRLAEAATAASEAKFRQLAETIPQLAWMARPDGDIFWYNRRWYEYTGTTPEQMEGWGWQRVHDPAVLPGVLERWKHSIATGSPFEMEFPLRRADGVFHPFLTRVEPLRNEAGEVVQWFGTNTDVTDQRRAAEEREQLLVSERAARTEAERASQMKDEFLATLSHELRTPLNAILGWATILKSASANSEDFAQGMDAIERNARSQTQIIEDLLDMSRIISGKVRLDVQRVALESVLRAAVETVKPAADAKGIRLHVVLDPLAGPVSGDPSRLQQVFWNLLSNAIRFTPKGGRVQVLLQRVNSHLEVSVIDTGEGIPPAFLPHVFDRFRQADSSTTRRHGGLGLGLAIVKQLVELHGGSVSAKSLGVGHGSTFTVSMPVTVVHPEPEPETTRRHPSSGERALPVDAGEQIQGVSVLVVDDEPDARVLIKRLLEAAGAAVVAASSVSEAMDRLSAGTFDVLVSDIGMPGEDGYSLIRRVRALAGDTKRKIPAVALTAYARAEDRVNSVRAGFDLHIPKPVEPVELIAMVASLVGRAADRGRV